MSDDKMREDLIAAMPESVNRIQNQLYSTVGDILSYEGLALVWYLIEQEFGQTTQRQGGEATAGMYGLSRSKLLTIVDELREAVLGMSDDDSPEAREEHLMDLTFHRYTQGDDGIQEGPFLCVNLSEYPEEGSYPIDQTGNAEARKTRVAQNAESDQQVDLSSVSDKQGGEAVAWDSEAVDPAVTKLYRKFKEWSQRGFTADDVTWCEVRAYVAEMLSAAPQPQPAVPEVWNLVPANHWASIKYHAFNGHQDRPAWKRFSLIQEAIRQAEAERHESPKESNLVLWETQYEGQFLKLEPPEDT